MEDKRKKSPHKGSGGVNKTKRLVICAALSALGVVVIYLGSLVDVMSISMAVIASLFCVIAVIEYGKGTPWLVYAVTAVLALVILPTNAAAWLYLCFFGFYPIIKEKLEKRKRLISWLLKEVIFNVALVLMLVGEKLLLTADTNEPLVMYLAFVALAEVAFPLYDIALTRLISVYVHRLRAKFNFK